MINPYDPPATNPLGAQGDEIDPRLYAAIEKLNKSTSSLTLGLAISIFIPIGMLFMSGFAIALMIKANKLYRLSPELLNIKTYCGNATKREIRTMKRQNPVLKTLSEFAQARIALWVIAIFPLIFIGILLFLLKLVGY